MNFISVMETLQNQAHANILTHIYVLDDKNCRKKALSLLYDSTYQKDKPNVIAATFSV